MSDAPPPAVPTIFSSSFIASRRFVEVLQTDVSAKQDLVDDAGELLALIPPFAGRALVPSGSGDGGDDASRPSVSIARAPL